MQRISLEQCHLYGITSPHALANRLGWSLAKLRSLANDGSYRVYKHKDTGRLIQEPGPALQSLHRQFHKYLARVETPDYLHSAVKGLSYLTNARAHVDGERLIKIDIAKFYQSVPQHKVMHFFRDTLKCAPDVAGLLAALICYDGALPTGSSISPIMSFYAFKGLFDELHSLAMSRDLVMTCYVDDITMSGEDASKAVLHAARTSIFRAGLRAHKDKQYGRNRPKVVTGVMITDRGIALPYSRWKKIQAATRELAGCSETSEKLKLYPRIVSRLYEATQIDPRCRARAEFHHGQWKLVKIGALDSTT